MSYLLLASVLLAAEALAQFVPAPTDLTTVTGYAGVPIRYKQVPTGICELDPTVRSYAGYADVGVNEHLHWWFFEARNVDPTTAPLTVWINGGPGSSSMIGLFQELGPCRIDSNYNVINNPYSFSNASNMLFIDEPVTVGFSYSEAIPAYKSANLGDIVQLPDAVCPSWPDVAACGTYSYGNESLIPNTTAGAAPNMWLALQGFMGAFPEYSRNGFHFTTESYGGHYGPIFNEYFEMQNHKNIKGAKKINLESVSIGNGWYDPYIQYQAYYNYTVNPGNPYDLFPFSADEEAQMYNALYGKGNCIDQMTWCRESGIDEICAAADNFCADQVEAMLDIYPENGAGRDEYDMRELGSDPFPPRFYSTYLNQPHVLAAVGAYTNFTSANVVGAAFGATGDDNREDGTVEAMRKLLKQNVRVTMYAGDADYNCNNLGGLAVADELAAPGYKKAGWVNVTTSDGLVNGQVRAAGNFSYVRVYYAGHEVPFYQPLFALEMFERIITGKDIATGNVTVSKNYRTVGPAVSTFKEGGATVQNRTVPRTDTYNTTTHAPNPYRKRSELTDIGGLYRPNVEKRMRLRSG